ncbi:MAG: flagellar hook-associated protein FlgK [Nitrospirae bacterium]|nr:flagellar hook-associated protein FlgK [Nitrospirota bacterium]
MSLGPLMDNARAGLTAARFGMELVGRNIANASTPGYSRQEVQFESVSSGGVRTWSVRSMVDNFVQTRIAQESQNQGRLDVERRLLSEVSPVLGTTETGLDAALTQFFGALSALTAAPDGTEERAQFMFRAENLVTEFNTEASNLDGLARQIDGEMGVTVTQVNKIAADIANLNGVISRAAGNDGASNQIIDQRTDLVNQLATLVDARSFSDGQGNVNVFVAGGMPLVEGINSYQLALSGSSGYSSHPGVAVIGPSGEQLDITQRVGNGALAGMIRIRDDVIGGALADIERIAATLTLNFNRVHAQGYGLDGSTGNAFFSALSASTVNAAENIGQPSVGAVVSDLAAVTLDDYEVVFTSPSQFDLLNATQGTTVSSGTAYTSGMTLAVDGLTLTLSNGASAPQAGDRVRVATVAGHGRNLDMVLTNQDKVAAATSLSTVTTASAGAQGTIAATVTDGTAVTFDSYDVTFNGSGQYSVRNVTTGATLLSNVPYVSGASFTVDGIQVTLANGAGSPAAGEVYTFAGEALPSANGNALALSALETEKLMDGGTLTLAEKFARSASQVGVEQQSVDQAVDAQALVMQALDLRRAAVSGVSLDEEAANLIKFQNTYQATARLIRVADEMLQTIINMV